MSNSWVALSLGTNLGIREQNLKSARNELEKLLRNTIYSRVYETLPVGYVEQPLFLNAAVVGSTNLSADQILDHILEIELKGGRMRNIVNGPRTIDIDLLLYGYERGGLFVSRSDKLILPHERMHERAFVLEPLSELIPEQIHPILNKSVQELANEIGSNGVSPVSDILNEN
tara:strand:- start:5 stop:520 length:516 start_codon:yes stop_codon:yes gene_type:complete